MADGGRDTAEGVWAALPVPWRVAFDEAWAAWCAGNFGVGAVLVDPDDGEIVSRGRNRVTERDPPPGTIGGNFLAHAEMNAFAAMPRFFARGLHLYTTLEPCLMCAAAAIQLNVAHVHFAVADEFFDGMHDMWLGHPYTMERRPARSGPLPGRLARFARVLPLSFTMRWMPDGNAATEATRRDPALADLARVISGDAALTAVRDSGGGAPDALDALWEHLGP